MSRAASSFSASAAVTVQPVPLLRSSDVTPLGESLGRGASGRVQLGRIGADGAFVALKIVEVDAEAQTGARDEESKGVTAVSASMPSTTHPTALQRLQHEQHILTRLKGHPGIVQLLGSFSTPSQHVSVLSLCPHGDLALRIRHHSRRMLPRATVRAYAAELVAAVTFVHSRGVRHRDLSARNVLLNAEGHIVLADFGMAAVAEEKQPGKSSDPDGQPCDASSSANALLSASVSDEGSVHYLAPERIRGGGIDADTYAADWWAIGVILYEMLFGVIPWNGSDADVRAQLLAYDGHVPLRPFPPLDDADTIDLLQRLLHSDPRCRLGTASVAAPDATDDASSSAAHPLIRDAASVRAHAYFRGIDWGSAEAVAAGSPNLWSQPAPPFDAHLSVLLDHE